MKAVTPAICKAIIDLQALPTVSKFTLGGGTNLALQFNHRISDDIDFFCDEIIGKKDLKKSKTKLKITLVIKQKALMILAI
jgi:hypothetical protein